MADSLTTKFENALIELIERYVDDGLTNADIRGVLDARRDDNHEHRDRPLEIFTEEQKAKFRAQDALYDETMKTP